MNTPNDTYTSTQTNTSAQPRFDPQTGRPLQPQMNFDPHTGQPLRPQMNFDPHTGQPLNSAQNTHRPTGGYPQTQATQPVQPAVPHKNEFFVGINLLSKIGVIFIIIGVIAFSAVSAPYLSPFVRTLVIFSLGILMTGLGEVFYRMKSVIFARALTIGGIGELAISVLIGYHSFESLHIIVAMILGVVISAGGLALSFRYQSQSILIGTVISGFLPVFLTLGEIAPLIIGMFYILLFQIAVTVISYIKERPAVLFVALTCNAITAPILFIAQGIMEMPGDTIRIVSCAYVLVSFGVYIIAAIADSYRDGGYISAINAVSFILSTVIASLMCLTFTISFTRGANLMAFGFIELGLALAFIATAAVAKAKFDSCGLITMTLNTSVALICISIFTIFSGELVYIVFHICAACLLLVGFFTDIRFLRNWGIITCSFAEFYFLSFCIINIGKELYTYQYTINVLLWLIIMTVLAIKGKRGMLFTAYSLITMGNTALYGCYMMYKLSDLLLKNDVINSSGAAFLLFSIGCSLVFMITAFVTGKLTFTAPANSICAIIVYGISLFSLFHVNVISGIADLSNDTLCLVLSIVLNVVSVAAALDMAFVIKGLAPKFARAIGLVVTCYAMFTMTFALGANEIVAFTSCYISIFYLIVAVGWIIFGFIRRFPLMRRFGLALTLLSSAKLFLFDFSGIDDLGRTIMFILFGIILLAVSFIYVLFERKLKHQQELEAQAQMQQSYSNNTL